MATVPSAPRPAEFHLLGPPRLTSPDGEDIVPVLSQPKRTAVLAYIALQRTGYCTRDRLRQLFWEELDEQRGRAALRQALHFLRRHLGRETILSRADQIGLAPDRLWCDAAAFLASLQRGQHRDALGFYRGPFLDGFRLAGMDGFEDWMERTRDDLARRASAGAWRLVSRAEGQGDAVEAISWARWAVERFPREEEPVRQFMLLLDRLGNAEGALREYELFEARTEEADGSGPLEEMLALVRRLRTESSSVPGRPFPKTSETSLAAGRAAPSASLSSLEPTLLVLPFRDEDGDSGAALISHGLTGEVIDRLSGVSGLAIVSSASAARLRFAAVESREVGRELGVEYVLQGTVRRRDGRMEVAVQLTDLESDAPVRAERYEGACEDLFEIREKVARDVVGALDLALNADQQLPLSDRRIQDIRAQECYLRARMDIQRLDREGIESALRMVDNALEIVGESELLLATRGHALAQFLNLGIQPEERHLEAAAACVERVFELNPRSVHGHALRGFLHFTRGDLRPAVEDLKMALSSNPSHRDALLHLALIYLIAGRYAAAAEVVDRLLRVDPLTPVNHCLPGYNEFLQGRFDDATPHYRRMYRLDPESPMVRWFTALALSRAGHMPEVHALLEALVRDAAGTPFESQGRFFQHALRGEKDEALRVVTPRLRRQARWDEHASWYLGTSYALLGMVEDSVAWLRNAARLGYIAYPFFRQHDPLLEGIRGDERFEAFLADVRSRWERFDP